MLLLLQFNNPLSGRRSPKMRSPFDETATMCLHFHQSTVACPAAYTMFYPVQSVMSLCGLFYSPSISLTLTPPSLPYRISLANVPGRPTWLSIDRLSVLQQSSPSYQFLQSNLQFVITLQNLSRAVYGIYAEPSTKTIKPNEWQIEIFETPFMCDSFNSRCRSLIMKCNLVLKHVITYSKWVLLNNMLKFAFM